MNYFRLLTRGRQAVFGVPLLAVFLLTAPIFAQERLSAAPVDETQKGASSEQTQKTTDEKTVEFSNQKLTVNDSLDSLKSKNQASRKSFVSQQDNSAKPQATPVDDTMMGVMGEGTESIKLGGHVGFVVPIVARGNGVTTNVGDRFVFGFPVGLTLKTKRNIAVDFEFIPTFNTGRDFVLTIHPGIIYGFAKHYAVGVRAAYDAGAGSYGFTPLVSRGFKINKKVGFFLEADFPVRSNYRAYQNRFGSIAFAAHAGFAF